MFIDVFAGKPSPEKLRVAEKLGIKIAPGHHTLLISKDHGMVRKKRKTTDFMAAFPHSKQEMNALLTDTYYDFVLVDFSLGKRNVRMAKRYETAIAVPLSSAFSLSIPAMGRIKKNLLLIQDIGGTLLLCSGARDASQIRGGRELAAIGVLLGLKPDCARKAVRHNPNYILNRNKERAKQEVWGVEK